MLSMKCAICRNLILQFEEVNKTKKTQRIIWSHPGNDVTGMVARSEKVAGTCEQVHVVYITKISKENAFCIHVQINLVLSILKITVNEPTSF
jgi:hypothetical protein